MQLWKKLRNRETLGYQIEQNNLSLTITIEATRGKDKYKRQKREIKEKRKKIYLMV